MYAQTDLADYYRGDLTLRQILVRIRAMPEEAPLIKMLDVLQAQERQQVEYDDAMAPFEKG